MTDDRTTPADSAQAVPTERTVAFYTDPRAAILLLKETVVALVSSMQIERGVIDLSTVSGVTIAAAFVEAGVPFDSLEFGQDDRLEEGPTTEDDVDELRLAAEGIAEVEIDGLGAIDANIVVIPTVGADGVSIDFGTTTVLGTVYGQIVDAERELLVVLPPERGLRPVAGGLYQRAIIHVDPKVDQA